MLHIETSGAVCSVAVTNGEEVIAEVTEKTYNVHARLLTTLIEQTMKQASLAFHQLDAIAVNAGPGSYTGLRIGLSTAKGLCYALGKPLLAVSAFSAYREASLSYFKEATSLFVLIDAGNSDIYAAIYQPSLEVVKQPSLVNLSQLQDYIGGASERQIAIGNGAEKHRDVLEKSGIKVHAVSLCASHLAPEALEFCKQSNFADLAYCEPYYGQDFVPKLPKRL